MEWDMDEDGDTLAAHLYRNEEIYCSIFIKRIGEEQYIILYENELIEDTTTIDQAIDIADLYIRGFMTGYDKGYDHGSTHQRPANTQRTLYPSGRGPAFPRDRRDRADDEGTGEGIGQD